MRFTYDLATADDDLALRRLIAETPMAGNLTSTFEREPGYLLGCATMGDFCQVLVARCEATGEVAGMLCRAAAPRFVNGRVERVGYLTQLRVAGKYRGHHLLRDGRAFFVQRHADGQARGYFMAVAADNPEAHAAFIGREAEGFPAMRPLDDVYTLGIIVGRPKREADPAGVDIGPVSPDTLAEMVAYLRREGAARQLFPSIEVDDFQSTGLTRDLCLEDFLLARRAGQIVGTAALWDQVGFKQTVIRGYHGSLRVARPLINVALRGLGAQALPAPGERLNFAWVSFVSAANDDPAVCQALLHRLYNLAAARRYAFLMLGFSERDPLLAVARRFRHIPYHSRIYAFDFDAGGTGTGWAASLDNRVVHIEVAQL